MNECFVCVLLLYFWGEQHYCVTTQVV